MYEKKTYLSIVIKKEQICEKFVKNRYKLELLKITN